LLLGPDGISRIAQETKPRDRRKTERKRSEEMRTSAEGGRLYSCVEGLFRLDDLFISWGA